MRWTNLRRSTRLPFLRSTCRESDCEWIHSIFMELFDRGIKHIVRLEAIELGSKLEAIGWNLLMRGFLTDWIWRLGSPTEIQIILLLWWLMICVTPCI
jgi:hypothetical protein